MSESPSTFRAKRFKASLLVLAAFLAALGFSEVIARLVPYKGPNPYFLIRHADRDVEFSGYLPDKDLLWKIAPNREYRIAMAGRPETWGVANRYGQRGPDFPPQKPGNEKRILFLGDSATFGLFVRDQDAYPFVVERMLNQGNPGPWRAVNAAVTGWASSQGLRYFRMHGKDFSPDIVCVLFGHNDMSVRLVDDATVMDCLDRYDRKSPSALWTLVRRAVLLAGLKRKMAEKTPIRRVPPPVLTANLSALADEIRACGAKPVFIACPGKVPLEPGERPAQEMDANPAVLAAAREKRVLFVPLEGMRAKGPGDNQNLFYDSYHPNEEGHKRIAQAIVSALSDAGMVD